MLIGLIVVMFYNPKKMAKNLVIVNRYYVSVNHLQILNNQVGKISKKIKCIGEQTDQNITICSSVYLFL